MRWIIFTLFLLLLAGSAFFAQERILFCDASFILTEILNRGSLAIQEHRYGSFITQIFPLLGAKAHLPMGTIVLLYSMSFNLFYLAVASVILFRFRNIKLAVVMAFYYTLFVSDTYFWTNNELHQAIAWMFLLLGCIIRYREKRYAFPLHFTVCLLLAFLSLFTHPLILLVLPFYWLFILTDKSQNPYSRKEMVLLSLSLVLICAVKFYMMSRGGYDTDKLRNTTHLSIKDILQAFTAPMAKIIIKKSLTTYYFIPLLFLAGVISAINQKRYKHLILATGFSLMYFVAVCLTFTNFVAFYAESEWMPITIIATSLFVYYTLDYIKPSFAIGLSIILLIRLGYIGNASEKFVARKHQIDAVLDKMQAQDIHKGFLVNDPKMEQMMLIIWGAPSESLISSSLRGDKISKTFFIDTEENIKKRMVSSPEYMVASFGPWYYKDLNPDYFNIDTLSSYQLIKE